MKKPGTLYGLGVGPGDPELMTQKAVRILTACDTVAIPQKEQSRCLALTIAAGAVPEVLQKPILCLDMPMTRDRQIRAHACDQAAKRLILSLEAGQSVAFLTLGDPSIYSTFGYLGRRVARAGFPVETVPGVPSFCAAAAAFGEPLCLDGEGLRILPGTGEPERETRVYMKGSIPERKKELQGQGETILAAQNVGMAGERLYRSLDEIPEDTGYFTLIIAKEKES